MSVSLGFGFGGVVGVGIPVGAGVGVGQYLGTHVGIGVGVMYPDLWKIEVVEVLMPQHERSPRRREHQLMPCWSS